MLASLPQFMRINSLFGGQPLGLVAFFFLFTPMLYSQPVAADSLRKAYEQERNPEKKLELYYDLALEIKELDLPATFSYADTLERMAQAAHYAKGEARALSLRARATYEQGDIDGAIPLYRDLLVRYRKIGDLEGEGGALNGLGACFAERHQSDSAMVYYIRSAEVKEKTGNLSDLASAYSNIGNLFQDEQAYDKGISYLEKALKIRQELGEDKRIIYTYNNLAVAYGTKGDIEQAMAYARKGISLALEQGNKFVAGVISGGIGNLLNKKGEYREAIRWCEQSAALLKEANRRPNLVFPLVNMATAYNSLNEPAKALSVAQEGYAIMLETGQVQPLEVYYEEMAKAYEKMGDYHQAYFWFKKFMVLDDSLFKADNVRNIAEMEARYETQKKEAEIAAQQLQLSEQQRRLFRQRTWIFSLAMAILALAMLGYLFYNRYRLRKKAELDAALIHEQKLGLNAVIEAQEAERRRIAKDLHDSIAQQLVALKLGFDKLHSKLAASSPDDARQLGAMAQQLDASCTEVRNISHVMLPPALEQHGLAPSLELLLRNSFQQVGIKTEFEYYGLPEVLDEKIEVGIYRIAQELVNNILKHSGAGRVAFQLYHAGGNLVLKVEDDGRSFDFEAARVKGSMGLLNILSRVANLGGAFFSEPGRPQGTISTVRIPL
ncbi:MAG: tetratricopeptide repeat protein [Phaeodactylibacter sp.]|nr:tetratricopeptide repeat protein [Phaeodactylibacter sp.]MCB9274988.1 tetratricopeptide repeat protein [Lewinellaceae bacterium]